MINDLLDIIISHGAKGAVIPYSHIEDIKKDMYDLKNGDYHTEWLDRMVNHITGDGDKFIPSDISFIPRSLITIAIPSPKVIVEFNYNGKAVNCVVPPHYTDWETKNKQALKYLDEYLSPHGFSVAIAITLPQKLLAVHSGLGKYGRNNICYNDEYGSYMQIMNYISDMPCEEAAWYPLGRMEICEACRACVSSCPTGAIDTNRQIVNTDRCITRFNDFPGEFPEWLDKDVHNSITGCIKCQDCCPANAHNKNNVVMGVGFTEDETTEILNKKDDSPFTGSLAAKVESTGIPPEFITNILPRNLTVLLQQTNPA